MNTLTTAFRNIASETVLNIRDHEPLALRNYDGEPIIERASWNGHEIVPLSDQEAEANHEAIVHAFTQALGHSAAYFSEEMRQCARASGLTRAMIKQVFSTINQRAKAAWSIVMMHSFMESIGGLRSQIHQLSANELFKSPDFPEEFKTEVVRDNLEIVIHPANEFLNYLNKEFFFPRENSEFSDHQLRGIASLEKIEVALSDIFEKTELAFSLLIDAVNQESIENAIIQESVEEKNQLADDNPVASSRYFYESSHAMLNATQLTTDVWRAKINGREELAQRFEELALSYKQKALYCEKIALGINSNQSPLITDSLSLAADCFNSIIDAREEALAMADEGDENHAALWADIAHSYEATISYTDSGVDAIEANHGSLAYHWLNAAGAFRLAIEARTHEDQQALVPFLYKAANVSLVSTKCVERALQAILNYSPGVSVFWTDAARVSHRHFKYREAIIAAVTDGDIGIHSIEERAERAGAYTDLLMEAAGVAEEGDIDRAQDLKQRASETYPDIEGQDWFD